jgi:hypothetical protein
VTQSVPGFMRMKRPCEFGNGTADEGVKLLVAGSASDPQNDEVQSIRVA